jgi:hypothetical protein
MLHLGRSVRFVSLLGLIIRHCLLAESSVMLVLGGGKIGIAVVSPHTQLIELATGPTIVNAVISRGPRTSRSLVQPNSL